MKIIFVEETPISKLQIGDLTLYFDGDVYDFREHFPYCRTMETEGAGIWCIELTKI